MLKKIFFLAFVICLSLKTFPRKLTLTYAIKSSKAFIGRTIPNKQDNFMLEQRLSVQERHKVKVFVLVGQSNATGYNNINGFHGLEKDFRAAFHKHSGILFWPGSNARTGFANRWVKLQVGVSDISGDKPFKDSCYGPEIGFGESIARALPGEKIAIIKYAVGATGIARSEDYNDYIPALKGFDDKGRNWHPRSDGKDPGLLYKNLIENIHTALSSLKDEGKNYKISGFIWMEGEHEAGISKKMANDYGKLLTLFIDSVRSDLDLKDLPFVIGEVNSNTWAFGDIVRKHQAKVCQKVPNCLLIKTTDLSRDGVGGTAHFDADGMLTLGHRFARGVLRLLIRR